MLNDFFTLFSILIFACCGTKTGQEVALNNEPDQLATQTEKPDSVDFIFKYNLKESFSECVLPRSLEEISGLSYLNDGQLLAVNDEQGICFTYDMQSCSLLAKSKFGPFGDYEGIERINEEEIFFLKSNGNLYHRKFDDPNFKEMYNTDLSHTNDVEGLAYDPMKNLLLLACKGSPDIKKYRRTKEVKSIFGINLSDKTFIEDPIIQVYDDALLKVYHQQIVHLKLSKKKQRKEEARILDFSPSGIAVHPIDNNYYILSSLGKLLVVVHPEGQILHVQLLDKRKFVQPEGICFDPAGNLYISNEGKAAHAKILTFQYNGIE